MRFAVSGGAGGGGKAAYDTAMNWRDRQRLRAGMWRRLSPGAYAWFLGGVFCLVGGMGLIAQIGSGAAWAVLLETGIYAGIVGAGFAWLGTQTKYAWMAVWAVATMVGWPTLRDAIWPPASTAAPPLGSAAVAAMAAVVAGYLLFLVFINTEGRKQFHLEAEVNLAGEIHRGLAPAIERRLGAFEFGGRSQASGQIGGDLLDVVEAEGGWIAYIADVSGHGVAAGVLMGVVKSAVRTWLAARGGREEGILPGLNRVLLELLPAESYVTLAALILGPDGGLQYAAAGHPPLLHFHAANGEVTRHGADNFPLGLIGGATFATTPIHCAEGDVLAIFTDGLVEIFDRQRGEFGLEGLSASLRASARLPLPQAAEAITAAARAFGAQTDDQTVLLLRLAHASASAQENWGCAGTSTAPLAAAE